MYPVMLKYSFTLYSTRAGYVARKAKETQLNSGFMPL
jgi:hypothetical protein